MSLLRVARLRVGYVSLSLGAYFGESLGYRERSVEGLRQLADEWNFDLVTVDFPVQDNADAVRAANELKGHDIDFLLVQNTSISIGGQFLPLVDAAPRLGIWSLPDPSHSGEVQLHSLVAMNEHTSILKRYLKDRQIPFKWFFDHVDTDFFQRRFGVTVRALTAVKTFENMGVGWVGGVSPGFHNMLVDTDLLHERLGVRVVEHTMADLVQQAETYAPERVRTLADEIRGVATAVTVSSETAFDRVTRIYLALKDMATDNNYGTMAVQCWSQIQELYGVVPCMAYSWLGSEDGFPVSCEGDVQGALGMVLLNILSGAEQSSTLLDLAAFDPKTFHVMMFHCGVTPRHFANADGIKWVDHVTLGRKSSGKKFGVAGDHVFAAQDDTTITYLGDNGSSVLVLRARIIERDVSGFDGTRGWFTEFELNGEPIDTMDLINTLTVRGHEHHFAMGLGDVTDELREFAAWNRLRVVERVPYADYLQLEGVNV